MSCNYESFIAACSKMVVQIYRPFACSYPVDLKKAIKLVWHDYFKSSIMFMLNVRLCDYVVSTCIIVNL